MKRLITSLAAVVLGLAVAGGAQAAGKGGGGPQGGFRSSGVQSGGFRNPAPVPVTMPFKKGTNVLPPTQQVPHVNKKVGGPVGGHDYLVKHAKKCHFGWCYPGSYHCHWGHCCWSPVYGCTIYWCPYTCGYFYWCAPHGCYYPVTYCPTGTYAY
ncbi:MAG TPA: hypothetical protein VNK04_23740 [Gemmataceae bacterium]|nr:hypothetical protein [Gemmataceae bacterium]